MKIKLAGFIEAVVITVSLAAIWFIYANYLLVKNPDNSYNFASTSSVATILTVAIVITFAVVLAFAYIIIRSFKRWSNKRASSKVTSALAYDLSRLYLENDFIDRCSRFGIEIGHNTVDIKPEILVKCSLKNLARLVVFVFHKNILSNIDFDKIFYSLADLIIEAWPDEVVQEFAQLVYKESIIIGEQLKYAVDRQKINREATEFNQSIEARLAAIEKVHMEKSLATAVRIDNQFQYQGYLDNGGSAFKKWFGEKFSFGRLLKSAIVK